jgi:hypothetical protein
MRRPLHRAGRHAGAERGGSVLVARPRKKKALDALEEIRASFRRSGITKEELLKAGRALRRRLSKEIRDAGR